MPNKRKLDFETQVELVQRYVEGEIGQCAAAREAGVDSKTFREWINRYKAEGAAAFLPRERNRSYSPELKLQAVQEYLSGKLSLDQICQKYTISSQHVVRNWIKKYNAHGDFYSVKSSGGGSYMKQGRDTTLEERVQIAEECLTARKNYGEMAKKYNVSYQQARVWTLRYEELGKVGLEDRRGRRKKDQTPRTELEKAQIEIEQLKHKLKMAEIERDLLKKLDEVVRGDASHK